MVRLSANLSILFPQVPFLDRFAIAAQAGFAYVEFWFAYDWPAQTIAQHMRAHYLQCVCLNTAPGHLPHDFGLAINPHRRDEFQASIHQALAYAIALDCPRIHVLAGLMQHPQSVHHETYVQNLAWACALAAQQDKTILIEPLNPVDRPGYFLNSVDQALEVIHAVNQPNLLLMYDAYHVQIIHGDCVSYLERCWPAIGHIQVADYPGRYEPFTGRTDFVRFFQTLQQHNYSGFVGCEYKPLPGQILSMKWLEKSHLDDS